MENIDLKMEFANVLVIDRLTADAIGPANARIYYLIGNAVYLLQSYLTECFHEQEEQASNKGPWTLPILHSILKWNNRFNLIVTVTNDCTRVTVYDLLVGRLVKPSGALSASSLKGPYNFNESI